MPGADPSPLSLSPPSVPISAASSGDVKKVRVGRPVRSDTTVTTVDGVEARDEEVDADVEVEPEPAGARRPMASSSGDGGAVPAADGARRADSALARRASRAARSDIDDGKKMRPRGRCHVVVRDARCM